MLNFNEDSIRYYEVTIVYYEGDLVKYKNHIYIAKEPIKDYSWYKFTEVNLAQIPPEYPIMENDYWKLIK
jgi:hypothetical protein